MAVVRWTDWDGHGLEHCLCRESAEGLIFEGVVAGTRHGAYGASYLVRTDDQYRVRTVQVAYIGGPRLHVECDGRGNWRDVIGNRPLPKLDGCIDVDIGMTPATNTLPIKRLNLRAQESREITVAYVPLLDQIEGDFLPEPAKQRYSCLVPGKRYLYEGLFRAFTAELEVDEARLVRDYPDTFRRVTIPE